MALDGQLFNLGLMGITSAAAMPGNYAKSRREGAGVVGAAASTTLDAAGLTFLNPLTAVAVGITAAVHPVSLANRANQNVRQTATPFSQRFEHTQATAHAQQYGLQSMGAMRGVGSEASLMYGRFGR